jgi:catechol 2,3-dioxygenase-like lactoylglutathione lyase family enzyme
LFDHIGIRVENFTRSRAFYVATLAPLDIELVTATDELAGFAPSGTTPETAQTAVSFWIYREAGASQPVHLAFRARKRDQVDTFWRAGLHSGGRDNGAPGLRASYHPHYYGAFVLDPDGHNIEAVCRAAA